MKFFILFLSIVNLSTQDIKLVQVFFRHGARTPELKDVYPNDPHKADAFLPMGWGQLTNYGKQQAYQLGKRIRERYSNFLGDTYYPEIVHAQSTDFDRTKMSAQLVLAGLFPPSEYQLWDADLKWLPIPVAYEKDNHDYFLKRPNTYCPVYLKELQTVLKSESTVSYKQDNKETFDYLSIHAGKSIDKLNDAFSMYQILTAEFRMNLTLPEWTNSVYPQEVTKLAIKQCLLENSTPNQRRLNGGRSLQKVIENLVAKAEDTLQPSQRKIFLYSGHENNIINILTALNIFDLHFPDYSSAVILELHYLKDQKEHAVKVLYSRSLDKDLEEKQLKNCDVLCPLETFIQLTKHVIPENYTTECGSDVNLD